MASSSKPTGVHYALIVSILISIVLGVFLLLAYKGNGSIGELQAKAKKAEDDAATWKKAAATASEQMDGLKKLIGSKYEIGTDDSTVNTVRWELADNIKKYGPGLTSQTINDLLAKLAEELRSTTIERDNLKASLGTELAQFQQKIDELNAALGAEKKARDDGNKAKIDAD